jgi:hypothetical protein
MLFAINCKGGFDGRAMLPAGVFYFPRVECESDRFIKRELTGLLNQAADVWIA